MNLFTQLAHQTLGDVPTPVTPRLAARFEDTAQKVPFTSDVIEVQASAIKEQSGANKARPGAPQVQGSAEGLYKRAVEARQGAEDMQANAVEARHGAEGMQTSVKALQDYTERVRANIPTTQSTVLANPIEPSLPTRSALLQRPTIEPMLAPQTGGTVGESTVLGSRPLVLQNEPAPAPTIRVSIGRVDVRAVVRPQEPRREPETPRAPAQTLDEYLRGGRGRQ